MFGNRNLTTNRNDLTFNPWSTTFEPFRSLRDEILDIFDDFNTNLAPMSERQFVPKLEIEDKGDTYVLNVEVPGMTEKDLNISVRGNDLILEGEKKQEHRDEKKGRFHSEFTYGKFYRVVPLSDEIDAEKITASFNDGILEVTVAKHPEIQSKVKKIPITKMKAVEGNVETGKKH
jgi:HSP20 family protein